MAGIPNIGTLVGAAIRPINTADLISTAYANEIKGGIHGYATLAERDSIIIQRRQWGMLVVIYDDPTPSNNKTYQLKYNNVDTDLMNLLNWVEYTGASSTNISEWQNSVKSILTTVPISPNDGDRYLVGIDQSSSIVGSPWAGNPGGFISEYNTTTTNWTNTLPTNGMTVRVDDQYNSLYKYEGDYYTGQWVKEKLTQVHYVDFIGNGVLYTTSISPTFSIYETDVIFLSKFDNSNTGSITININGVGIKPVKKPSINGLVDLTPNDIIPENIYSLSYDYGNDCFQFIKTYSNDSFNIKYYIEPNDYIVVPPYCQYWVYGDLTVDGTILNYGKIIVANGQLIIGTFGVVENYGDVDLISIGGGNSNVISSGLGKIKLTDATNQVFNDLAGAMAYVSLFTDAELTETSFSDNTFYFTVPANTDFLLANGFCGKITNAELLSFEDTNGLVVNFKESAFESNEKNNIFHNVTFDQFAFNNASGINIFNTCSAGNNSFNYCSGKFTFGNGNNFSQNSFQNASGIFTFLNNSNFGDRCFLASVNPTINIGNANSFGIEFLKNSTATGIFGSTNYFEEKAFQNLTSKSLQFGNENEFADNAFTDSSLIATFDSNNIFLDFAFKGTSGNVIFNNESDFGNECFSDSTGNFKLLGKNTFGNNCFENANPIIKNEIENLYQCGSNFALNYFGRFDILSKLGNDETQNLPNDIFTTAQIVNFNYPNALKYNNAGGKDGDLVNVLANISNLKSVVNAIINYSTDEIDTGAKWIDGKPIYRKVFSKILLTANDYIDIDVNIDKIIKLDGIIYSASDKQINIPFYDDLNNFSTIIRTDLDAITIHFSSYIVLDYADSTYYIIIEYTKN